ncbi:MAG: ECF transporter S component [Ruminococcaceae bacterium]|nr:ECF transporter S component [Oscillospiraceae bacterium]
MKNNAVYKLVVSALCLALCILLPFLTGQIPEVGNMLCPMHLPVFICAFLCGPFYALAVGLVAPVMRSLLFSMPPLFPTAVSMSFELCSYGLFAGLIYKLLPKKVYNIYISLICAMLVGRVVLGIVNTILLGSEYSFDAFLAGAFIQAVPGIILQIVLIPILVMAVNKVNKKG